MPALDQTDFKEIRLGDKFIKQSASGDQWFVCKKISIMDYEIISVHYTIKDAEKIMKRTSVLNKKQYKIIRKQDEQ